MVYDYNAIKQQFQGMSKADQDRAMQQFGNDENFRRFATEYNAELRGTPTQNQTPSQPQPSNPQPEKNYTQNQPQPSNQNWENSTQNTQEVQQSQQGFQTQTQNQHQFGYGTTEDYRKKRDSQYAEELYNSNPNGFDYNSVFKYVQGQAPQVTEGEIRSTVQNINRQYNQFARLGAMNSLSSEQIRQGLLNGEYSQSDLEQLRIRNPQKYNEFMGYDEKATATENAAYNANAIYKLTTGQSVKQEASTEEKFLQIVQKFYGDISYHGKELVESYKRELNSPEIQKNKTKMLDAKREMEDIDDELETLREDIRNQYPGISKSQLNSIVQDRSYKLLKRKNELHKDYTRAEGEMKFGIEMAGKNFEADLKGVELQRAEFQDKLSAFGFAKSTLEFETPEQKRQAELDQIKKKSQLEGELSDINSKDPKIQYNAVMKALDQYYKDFGSIILRPQSQAAQDIIAQAKREGISVGEAMRKNFTEPLQGKPEYRAMMNKSLGIDPNKGKPERSATVDKDGNLSYTLKGYGNIPDNLTRGQQQAAYKTLSEQSGNNPSWLATAMSGAIADGTTTGQCGEFTNDYLLALGGEKVFGDSLSQKMSKINGTEPKVGSVVVMDTGVKLKNGESAGHVGIVTKVNADGTIEITDSNWNSDKKKLTHTLSKEQMGMVKGYYYPQGVETPKYNESMKGYYMEYLDAKLTSSELKSLGLSSKEQLAAFGDEALQRKQNNQRKYIKEPLETIERLFKNYSSVGSTIGGAWQGAGKLLGNADYLSDYNYLKNNMTLEHLVDLKSRGATFGALSEGELNAIGNSASRIDLLNSETKFKQELLSIYNGFLSSAGYDGITLEELESKAKGNGGNSSSQASAFEDLKRKNTRGGRSSEVDLIYNA